MRNENYFDVEVSQEQLSYAKELVQYSIDNHPVSDIFSNDPGGKQRQFEFRLTGTLGEVMFADIYAMPRPTRSFGAIDGQDYGQDFNFSEIGKEYSIDVKSMRRKSNKFRTNYVLNLPKYQMDRDFIRTDFYFCISLFEKSPNTFIASFLGYVSKLEIQDGKLGILYKSGTKRIKDDGGTFIFQRDTYEVDFKDITTPFKPRTSNLPGFSEYKILNPYK